MKKKSYSTKKLITYLIPFIKPFKLLIFICIFIAIIDTLVGMSEAYLTKELVNAALKHNSADLYQFIILMIIIIFFGIGVTFLFKYIYGFFSSSVLLKMRQFVMLHIQKLPVSFMENNHSGDLISRVSGDLAIVQNFISGDFLNLIVQVLSFIAAFSYMLILNWQLLCASIILIPPALLIIMYLNKPVQRYTRTGLDYVGNATSVLQDTIGGINMVKAFNIGDYLYSKYKKHVTDTLNLTLKKIKILSWSAPLDATLRMLPTVLCFSYGGFMAYNGKLSPGELLSFSFLLGYITWPLSYLPSITSNIRDTLGAAERLAEVLEIPQERKTGTALKKSDSKVIDFGNVSFSYNKKVKVLKDFNLSVPYGKKIAIVGPSGSGKSTIVKILCGFYENYQGQVKLYDREIKKWSLNDLRSLFSLVSQETFLFPVSIYENILFGRTDAGKEEVIKAAKDTYAHEFISKLKNGYDTLVGERGIKLSGGQKQRIALARAILKNAPILLFDEATSALDTHSEMIVQKAMNKIMKNKTVIIIAHRLSTIKDVDEIIVVDKGSICEKGTHDELISKKGLYSELYLKQFDKTEDLVN